MALAGYSKKDIEVEVADGVLSIKSIKKTLMVTETIFIMELQIDNFTRKFTLADDIVVKDGKLEDGMLTIELERITNSRGEKTSYDYYQVITQKGRLDISPFLCYGCLIILWSLY